VAGQVAQGVLVDEHPGGGGGEAGAQHGRRSLRCGMAKPSSMTAKKAKKNFASGFSTGAPVAIGNMPT
jgi:hypothetical protein